MGLRDPSNNKVPESSDQAAPFGQEAPASRKRHRDRSGLFRLHASVVTHAKGVRGRANPSPVVTGIAVPRFNSRSQIQQLRARVAALLPSHRVQQGTNHRGPTPLLASREAFTRFKMLMTISIHRLQS